MMQGLGFTPKSPRLAALEQEARQARLAAWQERSCARERARAWIQAENALLAHEFVLDDIQPRRFSDGRLGFVNLCEDRARMSEQEAHNRLMQTRATNRRNAWAALVAQGVEV
jgi:hypothetical protein